MDSKLPATGLAPVEGTFANYLRERKFFRSSGVGEFNQHTAETETGCGLTRPQPQPASALERDNGVDAKRELVIFLAAVERKADRASQTIIPIPAAFGPHQQIAARPPVQAGGDIVEVAGIAATSPGVDPRDIPRARDADAIVVTQPLDTQIGLQLRIEGVKEVLVEAVPLRCVSHCGGVLLRAQVLDGHILQFFTNLLLNDEAVDETILVARNVVEVGRWVLGTDRNRVSDFGAFVRTGPLRSTHEIKCVIRVLEHQPATMETGL